MAEIKKQEIVNVYRKILDPLGYSVVAKPRTHKQWEPEKIIKEKYAAMDSEKLESELTNLKEHKTKIESQIHEVKTKIADYLNKEGPNALTKRFYTETYGGKDTISKGVIKVDSIELRDTLNLITFLESLQKETVAKELVKKMKELVPEVQEIFLDDKIGPIALVIRLG